MTEEQLAREMNHAIGEALQHPKKSKPKKKTHVHFHW